MPVLGHSVLQQVGHAAGHLHLAHPRRVVGDQLLVVGVGGQRDRAGVRHRHRDGAQPDRLADAQPLGQQPYRGDEALPAQVRLHAREQQERRPDAVVQRVQAQLGFLVVGEVVGLERHQRPPRPVVQQFVDGERRHQLGVQRVLQVLRRPAGSRARRPRSPPGRGSSPARGRPTRTIAAPGTPARTFRSARVGSAAPVLLLPLLVLIGAHLLDHLATSSVSLALMHIRPDARAASAEPAGSCHRRIGCVGCGSALGRSLPCVLRGWQACWQRSARRCR